MSSGAIVNRTSQVKRQATWAEKSMNTRLMIKHFVLVVLKDSVWTQVISPTNLFHLFSRPQFSQQIKRFYSIPANEWGHLVLRFATCCSNNLEYLISNHDQLLCPTYQTMLLKSKLLVFTTAGTGIIIFPLTTCSWLERLSIWQWLTEEIQTILIFYSNGLILKRNT